MEKQSVVNVTSDKKAASAAEDEFIYGGYSHHTVYFPKRKTVILNISRESSAQIQNLVFLLLIT